MIVTTTGMVTDMVRHIAGEDADVVGLMGEGIDPHLYRPTASDIGRMMHADVVFYTGLSLEGQMQQAFEQFASQGKVACALGEAVPESLRRYPEGFAAHPDPHVWHAPRLWSLCVDRVVEVLAAHLPEKESNFRANAGRYRQQLARVDDYARRVISSIPKEHRYLVTAHDAFGYFSAAYDIPVRSVQGITTESDPGVADINELVEFLVRNKVPALFVEATVNQANLKAVIEGARRRGWQVTIGGMLYSDSMGPPGTYEGTYVGMIDYNATVIARALGGSAPHRGMDGKLTIVD